MLVNHLGQKHVEGGEGLDLEGETELFSTPHKSNP